MQLTTKKTKQRFSDNRIIAALKSFYDSYMNCIVSFSRKSLLPSPGGSIQRFTLPGDPDQAGRSQQRFGPLTGAAKDPAEPDLIQIGQSRRRRCPRGKYHRRRLHARHGGKDLPAARAKPSAAVSSGACSPAAPSSTRKSAIRAISAAAAGSTSGAISTPMRHAAA